MPVPFFNWTWSDGTTVPTQGMATSDEITSNSHTIWLIVCCLSVPLMALAIAGCIWMYRSDAQEDEKRAQENKRFEQAEAEQRKKRRDDRARYLQKQEHERLADFQRQQLILQHKNNQQAYARNLLQQQEAQDRSYLYRQEQERRDLFPPPPQSLSQLPSWMPSWFCVPVAPPVQDHTRPPSPTDLPHTVDMRPSAEDANTFS